MKYIVFSFFAFCYSLAWAEPINVDKIKEEQIIQTEIDLYGRIIPLPAGEWLVRSIQDSNVIIGVGAAAKKSAKTRQIILLNQQADDKNLVLLITASEPYFVGSRWMTDCVPKNAISSQSNGSYDWPECNAVFIEETEDKTQILISAYKKYAQNGFIDIQIGILPFQYSMPDDWQSETNSLGKELIKTWTTWTDSYLLAIKNSLNSKPYVKSEGFHFTNTAVITSN